MQQAALALGILPLNIRTRLENVGYDPERVTNETLKRVSNIILLASRDAYLSHTRGWPTRTQEPPDKQQDIRDALRIQGAKTPPATPHAQESHGDHTRKPYTSTTNTVEAIDTAQWHTRKLTWDTPDKPTTKRKLAWGTPGYLTNKHSQQTSSPGKLGPDFPHLPQPSKDKRSPPPLTKNPKSGKQPNLGKNTDKNAAKKKVYYLPDGPIPVFPKEAIDVDDENFCWAMEELGYTIYTQKADGHCAYRSLSMAMYGHPHSYGSIRYGCIELVTTVLWDEMRPFIIHPEDTTEQEKKAAYRASASGNSWAGPVELNASTRITGRPIYSHSYGMPMIIYDTSVHSDAAPIELSYHRGNHYNYVVNKAGPPTERPEGAQPADLRQNNDSQPGKPRQTGKRRREGSDGNKHPPKDGTTGTPSSTTTPGQEDSTQHSTNASPLVAASGARATSGQNSTPNTISTTTQYKPRHYNPPNHSGKWDTTFKKRAEHIVHQSDVDEIRTLDIDPGPHGPMTTTISQAATAAHKRIIPTTVKSPSAMAGSAPAGARTKPASQGGMVMEGHSTNTHTIDHMLTRTDAESPHVLMSGNVGNTFAANAYPFIYSEALRTGIISPTTLSVPAAGATLWKPGILTHTRPVANATVLQGPGISYFTSRNDALLSNEWGLTDYYDLQTDLTQAKAQLTQIRTSRVQITKAGEMDSLMLAVWADLGPIRGTHHDPLAMDCPDLLRLLNTRIRGSVIHSAPGYDGYSNQWQNPRVHLKPSEPVCARDFLTVTSTTLADPQPRLTLTVELERDGEQIRVWHITVEHKDPEPIHPEPSRDTVDDTNPDIGIQHEPCIQQTSETDPQNSAESLSDESSGSQYEDPPDSHMDMPTETPASPSGDKEPPPFGLEGTMWGDEPNRGYKYQDEGPALLYLAVAEWLPSEIDGEPVARLGLFTSTDIKPRRIITTYAGISEYSHTSEVGTPKADYMMTLMPAGRDGMALVINGLRKPAKGYGLGSFCNDRRTPGSNNAKKVAISAIGSRGQGKHMGIFIESTKLIPAFTEVTISYGRGYFLDQLPKTDTPLKTTRKREHQAIKPETGKRKYKATKSKTGKIIFAKATRDPDTGQYTWEDVEVRSSKRGRSGRGLYARSNLKRGLAIPALGRIITPDHLKDLNTLTEATHIWQHQTQGIIDGAPDTPNGQVQCNGLAAAMMTNEPVGEQEPNCYFMHGYLILTRDVRRGQQLTVYYGDSKDLDRHRKKAGYSVNKSRCQDLDGSNDDQDVWARDNSITTTDMHEALEPWITKCAAKDEHRVNSARDRAQAQRALRAPGPHPTHQPTMLEMMHKAARTDLTRTWEHGPRTPTTPASGDDTEQEAEDNTPLRSRTLGGPTDTTEQPGNGKCAATSTKRKRGSEDETCPLCMTRPRSSPPCRTCGFMSCDDPLCTDAHGCCDSDTHYCSDKPLDDPPSPLGAVEYEEPGTQHDPTPYKEPPHPNTHERKQDTHHHPECPSTPTPGNSDIPPTPTTQDATTLPEIDAQPSPTALRMWNHLCLAHTAVCITLNTLPRNAFDDTDSYHKVSYDTMSSDSVRKNALDRTIVHVASTITDTCDIIEVGPGMHAPIIRKAASAITARNIRVNLIMIESPLAAEGLAIQGARRQTKQYNSKVIAGFSTEPRVRAEISQLLTSDPRLFFAEIIGNFFSSESYPYIFADACTHGIIRNDTIVMPQEGATVWRPSDYTKTPIRKGTPVIWARKILYTSPVTHSAPSPHPHFLSGKWGLMEHYKFMAHLFGDRDQTLQETTSTVDITDTGELNSITFAMWARLGQSTDRASREPDALVKDTPDLLHRTQSTTGWAHINSAHGYEHCARNWLTPIVILDPPAHVTARHKVTIRSTINATGKAPSYKYDIRLYDENGLTVQTWVVSLSYNDIRPVHSKPGRPSPGYPGELDHPNPEPKPLPPRNDPLTALSPSSTGTHAHGTAHQTQYARMQSTQMKYIWAATTGQALGPRPTVHPYDVVLDMIEHRRNGRGTGGVMNNQKRGRGGSHWLMWTYSPEKGLTMYDPYGHDTHSNHIAEEAIARGHIAKVIPIGQQNNTDGWSCGYIVMYWIISSARAADHGARWHAQVITPPAVEGWTRLIHLLTNLDTMEEDRGTMIGGKAWAPTQWKARPLTGHGAPGTMNIAEMTLRTQRVTRQANTMWSNRRTTTTTHRTAPLATSDTEEDIDNPEVEERGQDWAEVMNPPSAGENQGQHTAPRTTLLDIAMAQLPLIRDIERAETSFLLIIYGHRNTLAWEPTDDYGCSMAARAVDPDTWGRKWPPYTPPTGTPDINTLHLKRDDEATATYTLHSIWTWMTGNTSSRQEWTRAIVTRIREAPPPATGDWLIPHSASSHRCLLITHTILSATQYGRDMRDASTVSELAPYILDMLDKTAARLANTRRRDREGWTVKRLECIYEMYYTLTLISPPNVSLVPESALRNITRSLTISPGPLFLTRTPSLTARMSPQRKAHYCITALMFIESEVTNTHPEVLHEELAPNPASTPLGRQTPSEGVPDHGQRLGKDEPDTLHDMEGCTPTSPPRPTNTGTQHMTVHTGPDNTHQWRLSSTDRDELDAQEPDRDELDELYKLAGPNSTRPGRLSSANDSPSSSDWEADDQADAGDWTISEDPSALGMEMNDDVPEYYVDPNRNLTPPSTHQAATITTANQITDGEQTTSTESTREMRLAKAKAQQEKTKANFALQQKRHADIATNEYDPTIIDETFHEHSDISTPLSEFRNLGRRSAVVTRQRNFDLAHAFAIKHGKEIKHFTPTSRKRHRHVDEQTMPPKQSRVTAQAHTETQPDHDELQPTPTPEEKNTNEKTDNLPTFTLHLNALCRSIAETQHAQTYANGPVPTQAQSDAMLHTLEGHARQDIYLRLLQTLEGGAAWTGTTTPTTADGALRHGTHVPCQDSTHVPHDAPPEHHDAPHAHHGTPLSTHYGTPHEHHSATNTHQGTMHTRDITLHARHDTTYTHHGTPHAPQETPQVYPDPTHSHGDEAHTHQDAPHTHPGTTLNAHHYAPHEYHGATHTHHDAALACNATPHTHDNAPHAHRGDPHATQGVPQAHHDGLRPAHKDAPHAHYNVMHLHHGAPQRHHDATHTRHDAMHVHNSTPHAQHETSHMYHDTTCVPHHVPHTHHGPQCAHADMPHTHHTALHTHRDARTTPHANRTTPLCAPCKDAPHYDPARINRQLCNAPPLTNLRAPPAWNHSTKHTNHAAPLIAPRRDTPTREPLANIKHATHTPGPSWPGNANHNTSVECLQSSKPKPTKRPRRPEGPDGGSENPPKRPKLLGSTGRKRPRLTDENEDRGYALASPPPGA